VADTSKKDEQENNYFFFAIPITAQMQEQLGVAGVLADMEKQGASSRILFARHLAGRLNRLPARRGKPVPAGLLNLFALLGEVHRFVVARYEEEVRRRGMVEALGASGRNVSAGETVAALTAFAGHFPGIPIARGTVTPAGFVAADPADLRKGVLLRELLLLRLASENPALDPFRELFDDAGAAAAPAWREVAAVVDRGFGSLPPLPPFAMTLPELLRAPAKASPHSLAGQIDYIREHWQGLLPLRFLEELLTSLDIAREEERQFFAGPGKPQVLRFPGRGGAARDASDYPEFERFSPDADWMPNVVMIAKMVYVWLDQLTKKYGRPINRLDQVPDEELDRLARWGFSALWLIGLWERSPASAQIKRIGGNPDAISSAYSLYDYTIAADLGGEGALHNLRERCKSRGIRLASDMVPNHTGIYSRWAVEHPDWFIQLDYPPYPAYSFNGPDLSFSPEVSLHIEDGYWDRRDAAVVFKHYDHRNGRTRYIYHGNDGTSTPWNDTAQLDYLLPAVREAVIGTILHVARQFPIIRFDAAMTLAKKHYQRLWFPQPGHGSGVPSRAEHGMSREDFDRAFPAEFWREVVDRVAAEAPGTLLLAEAFWLMEGYFVRTLGMHRVYNSAFMNMLKMEENAKYRQTIKNVLEYDHRILQRFVNFMNNPDERTAVEQFGKEGKYFGACVLLVTMPGLPMFGHGQIEGFHEKYGMEYRRAYWDEPVDEHLVSTHERLVFPLMRRRHLFSGSENFVFYDFHSGDGVDENVFAYSNRLGDERGLIVYNNRYGETAGWIRTSTAFAEVGTGEEVRLGRTTLGEALGCHPDGRRYYAFRNYATGLEYLRGGPELCDRGLFVRLGAYGYCAFLDVREIVDDEYGTWGKLCHLLQGSPVASLEEEVKQVRHGELIDAFRDAVAAAAKALAEPGGEEGGMPVTRRIARFRDLLASHTACAPPSSEPGADSAAGITVAAGLLSLLRGEATDFPAVHITNRLVAAYLLLRDAGGLVPEAIRPATAAAWFDELGLSRAFSEPADAGTVEGMPAAGEESALLGILLLRQLFFAGWRRDVIFDRCRELFADPVVRDFLGCHWSGGIEWFSRERFELLTAGLAVAALVGTATAATGAKPSLSAEQECICRELLHLHELALTAGYQPVRLLRLAEKEAS